MLKLGCFIISWKILTNCYDDGSNTSQKKLQQRKEKDGRVIGTNKKTTAGAFDN